MYKEKLQAQLELLEEVQQKSKDCCEAIDVIELSNQILHIARKLDEIEEAQEPKERELIVTLDGKEIFTKSIL